jgi:hypothetical protein
MSWRDPIRHPAARAVSRHVALGVHCRGARRDRRHDLRPSLRLAPGGADDRHLARRDRCQPVGAGRPSYGAIALAIFLFFLSIRCAGERVGRLSERLEFTEKTNDVQRQMLEAAARRRDHDELAERLRDG